MLISYVIKAGLRQNRRILRRCKYTQFHDRSCLLNC